MPCAAGFFFFFVEKYRSCLSLFLCWEEFLFFPLS